MKARRFLTAVASLLLISGVSAQQLPKLTHSETDSVASALATIWGDYMKSTAAKQGKEVNKEYMRGVKEAIDLAAKDDAYYQGLSEGIAIVKRIKQVEELGMFEVNLPRFMYKLQRAADGKTTGFTSETANRYMNKFIGSRTESVRLAVGSPIYLDSISKLDGVIKTPSGLLYEVLREGEGDTPGAEDLVKIDYTGRFINGKVFNASPENDHMVMAIPQAIPGFGEGLQLMKRGGRYRLYIPSELGYGSRGVSGVIPPDVATIFDVEMIDFRKLTDEERQAVYSRQHVGADDFTESADESTQQSAENKE